MENTASVTEWFENIKDKKKSILVTSDIVSFYAPISENLLKLSLNHVKQFASIMEQEINIIMHLRKKQTSFRQKHCLGKQDDGRLFDAIMGSYDGAKVCKLVGLYVLIRLSKKFDKASIGQYRETNSKLDKNPAKTVCFCLLPRKRVVENIAMIFP